MKPIQIRTLLRQHKIDTLEVAAYSGMPQEYVDKLLDEDAPSMEHDLIRLKKAIDRILRDRAQPDSDPGA